MKLTFAVVLAGTTALAACGSSGSNSGTKVAAGDKSKALAFARCMRAHGVSNFPDPSGGHLNLEIQKTPNSTSVNGVEVNSPTFTSAMNACKADLPNGGNPTPPSASQRAAALRFAQCMRSHGVPSFPDPQLTGGGVRIRAGGPGGVNFDPNSPAFKAAQHACGSLIKGAFTQRASAGG